MEKHGAGYTGAAAGERDIGFTDVFLESCMDIEIIILQGLIAPLAVRPKYSTAVSLTLEFDFTVSVICLPAVSNK